MTNIYILCIDDWQALVDESGKVRGQNHSIQMEWLNPILSELTGPARIVEIWLEGTEHDDNLMTFGMWPNEVTITEIADNDYRVEADFG